MESRKIPSGRLGRIARLAAASARSGMGLLRDGRGAAAREAADQAAEVLGTMRGLAAKIGQMASYVDGFVPEEHREAYQAAMKGLQSATRTTAPAEVRAILAAELGAPIEQLFASFEETPFASASLGQVHRAVTRDGAHVAVKVQHADVDLAVKSDLANAGILESMAALGGTRRMDSKAILAEVRARFLEELDYALEARRQAQFAELHAGDPTIRIPRVEPSLSSSRVLTSELVSGLSFDEACARGEDDRRAWCETLWRFVFRGNLVGGMFNADPHPGNYLFHEGGSITFLDFGCVSPIPEARRPRALAVHQAALARDERAFRDAAAALLETEPGPYEDAACAYSRLAFEPVFASPYRITRAYTTGLAKQVMELKDVALKHLRGTAPFPPDLVFLNRLQFGFFSVLARLDAEVDYHRVETAFCPR